MRFNTGLDAQGAFVIHLQRKDPIMLDKAIEHGKEHRKPYHGAEATDKTCRPHGSDFVAQENRLFRNRRREKDDIEARAIGEVVPGLKP